MKAMISKVATAAVATVVGFVICELGLRAVDSFSPINAVPTQYHAIGGIRNWGGYSGCFNREGFSCFRINSNGWRDVEHKIEKLPNTFRIAVVGDSFVEALQVQQEDAFWKVLERVLQNKMQKNVEVMAFGMSGFDLAQAFEVIRKEVLQYKPDIIVHAFFAENDLRDSIRVLADHPWKPYYFTNDKNELTLDDSYLETVRKESTVPRTLFRNIRNSSHAFLRLDRALRTAWQKLAAIFNTKNTVSAMTSSSAGTVQEGCQPGLACSSVYTAPDPGTPYFHAWELVERLFLEANSAAQSIGAKFIVLGVTTSDAAYQRPITPQDDPFYADRRIGRFLKSNNITYVSLVPALIRANRRGFYFHGFGEHAGQGGHWNEFGHKSAAKELSHFITEE